MVSLELEARLDNLLSTAQTETADIDLFAPITEREECPICLIPLPLKNKEVVFEQCCGKLICQGCTYRHMITDARKGGLSETKCAFCCQLSREKNNIKSLKKLMKNNNPRAFMQMATEYRSGNDGVFQSDTKSLEMLTKAAELGHADAFTKNGLCYELGTAVEEDMSKAVAFYELGAKKGSIPAHVVLAEIHKDIQNSEESNKHLKVAACAGDQASMDALTAYFKDKLLSKEDLTKTLRAFQASQNEMKSKDRDDARLMEESHKKGETPPAHLFE